MLSYLCHRHCCQDVMINPSVRDIRNVGLQLLDPDLAQCRLTARAIPRGESEPPDVTFGPPGDAERLNWLIGEETEEKHFIHFLITGRSKARRFVLREMRRPDTGLGILHAQ